MLAFPLVGAVMLKGKTPREAENTLEKFFLESDFFTAPDVAIELAAMRQIYVLGEVETPGKYEYISDMLVINAIAIAGGLSYRANGDVVDIEDGSSAFQNVPLSTPVHPGNDIIVQERFF